MTLRLSIERVQLGWGDHGERLLAKPQPTIRCGHCSGPATSLISDLVIWNELPDGSTRDVVAVHQRCVVRPLPPDMGSCPLGEFLTRLTESVLPRPHIEPWSRVLRRRQEDARKARAERIRAAHPTPPELPTSNGNGSSPQPADKPEVVFG